MNYNQDEQQKAADDFEITVGKELTRLKIRFKTQEQLIKEGSRLTPDFLILGDLVINNISIRWIDAKNFYGSNVSFVTKKVAKQALRYQNAFGDGGFIFSLGYSVELMMDNILFFDYIDLTLLEIPKN